MGSGQLSKRDFFPAAEVEVVAPNLVNGLDSHIFKVIIKPDPPRDKEGNLMPTIEATLPHIHFRFGGNTQ